MAVAGPDHVESGLAALCRPQAGAEGPLPSASSLWAVLRRPDALLQVSPTKQASNSGGPRRLPRPAPSAGAAPIPLGQHPAASCAAAVPRRVRARGFAAPPHPHHKANSKGSSSDARRRGPLTPTLTLRSSARLLPAARRTRMGGKRSTALRKRSKQCAVHTANIFPASPRRMQQRRKRVRRHVATTKEGASPPVCRCR